MGRRRKVGKWAMNGTGNGCVNSEAERGRREVGFGALRGPAGPLSTLAYAFLAYL